MPIESFIVQQMSYMNCIFNYCKKNFLENGPVHLKLIGKNVIFKLHKLFEKLVTHLLTI